MAHDNDRLARLEDRLARIETVLEAELGVPLDEVITDLEFADAELVEELSTSEDTSAASERPEASAPDCRWLRRTDCTLPGCRALASSSSI